VYEILFIIFLIFVVVVVVVSLVLIKNAFGIIKTKQQKKKREYETLTESPKKLNFC